MKSFVFVLAALVSSNAFAGSYNLQCSNADGTIRVDRDQITITSGDSKVIHSLNMQSKNLELWDTEFVERADIQLKAEGRARILSDERDNSCRMIRYVTLAQEFKLKNLKNVPNVENQSVYLICQEDSVSTTGGRDCTR